ncbi:hypothetical protein [Planococcus sp. 107-1]|uniref:hypothetical protein n=1 Tax=Planococcus sp. 107-1 TaxID=2908840 RepID=UPI001F37DBDC|nr:hypothetical protein [Planococcus sp. 107-1]UJF26486.1 hypothetical protein L0M13_15255 [Planococcus sp. 107-1]
MAYVDIGSKLFFGLIALLVVTRLLGKKEMSQLTPFDFIYSIVLGGILEESIYDDKVSGLHVWFAVAVWGPCFLSSKNCLRSTIGFAFC